MRDYKAECAALRAELRETRAQRDYAIKRLEAWEESERERIDKLAEALRRLLGLDR